jgi:hypothetical protein
MIIATYPVVFDGGCANAVGKPDQRLDFLRDLLQDVDIKIKFLAFLEAVFTTTIG